MFIFKPGWTDEIHVKYDLFFQGSLFITKMTLNRTEDRRSSGYLYLIDIIVVFYSPVTLP